MTRHNYFCEARGQPSSARPTRPRVGSSAARLHPGAVKTPRGTLPSPLSIARPCCLPSRDHRRPRPPHRRRPDQPLPPPPLSVAGVPLPGSTSTPRQQSVRPRGSLWTMALKRITSAFGCFCVLVLDGSWHHARGWVLPGGTVSTRVFGCPSVARCLACVATLLVSFLLGDASRLRALYARRCAGAPPADVPL